MMRRSTHVERSRATRAHGVMQSMIESAPRSLATHTPSSGVHTRAACLLALLAILIGGCNTPFGDYWGRDYRTVEVPMQRLREIEPIALESHSLSPPRDVDDAAMEHLARWSPQAFNEDSDSIELTLADVRAASLANNLDLRVAFFDPAIAETVANEESARFEWTFTSTLRHSDFENPTADLLTGSQVTNTNADLGVRVPLYTGGTLDVNLPLNRRETDLVFSVLDPAYSSDLRFSFAQPLLRNAGLRVNTHGIRVARYEQQIVDARTKLETIRVLAAADRAYWRLYAAVKELDVRLRQYELAERQLERAQRRVDAGVDVEIEVLRAEAGVAERLEAIILAENAIRQRQRDLKRIMNIPDLPIGSPVRILLSTDPSPLGLDLDARALARLAVANRLEMLELELQLAIDASTIELQRNQALPLFMLDYTYQIAGLGTSFSRSFDMVDDRAFDSWAVGLTAEIPLGNDAANARVNRALLQRIQRLATRSQRELAIEQEVLDASDALETTWQRILAARQSAILAGRRLQGEQRQFDVGVRTSTDVLDAAAGLADAQLAEIRALADYQIAMIDIAFATGTLLGSAQIEFDPDAERASSESAPAW